MFRYDYWYESSSSSIMYIMRTDSNSHSWMWLRIKTQYCERSMYSFWMVQDIAVGWIGWNTLNGKWIVWTLSLPLTVIERIKIDV